MYDDFIHDKLGWRMSQEKEKFADTTNRIKIKETTKVIDYFLFVLSGAVCAYLLAQLIISLW